MVNTEDKTMSLLAHLLGIVIGFLGPLILFLVKKDSKFVYQNARNALNFQLTLLIGWVAAFVLTFVLIGMLLYPVLFIVNIVFSVIGAIQANEGKVYKYPVAIEFIKQ